MTSGQLYICLVHGPVCDKSGKSTTTSITPIDLADLARSAKTFDAGLLLVQPDPNQRALAFRLLQHWQAREEDHPDRHQAMDSVQVFDTVDSMVRTISPDMIVGTTAARGGSLTFAGLRDKLPGQTVVLLFGTGYGLTAETLTNVDAVLEPICGRGGYNHLSVRSAAAICLDRVWGL